MQRAKELSTILHAIRPRSILHIGQNGEAAKQVHVRLHHAAQIIGTVDPWKEDNMYKCLRDTLILYDTVCIDADRDRAALYGLLLHCEECMRVLGACPVFVLYNAAENREISCVTTDFLAGTAYVLHCNRQQQMAVLLPPSLQPQHAGVVQCIGGAGWKREETERAQEESGWELKKAEAHIHFQQSIRTQESRDFGGVWETMRRDQRVSREDRETLMKNHSRVVQSRSWRWTAPLRRAERFLRGLFHKSPAQTTKISATPGRETRAPVAVIIPCHNYGKYLAECIGSVLRQTAQPQEILVVDDASADDTPQVAGTFAARGVQYMRGNWKDVCKARNAGALATDAPYLIFLDADDALAADYIEQCLVKMQDPAIAVAYGHLVRFGELNHLVSVPEYDREMLMKRNFISSHAMMRRQAFDMVGGYRSCQNTHQDWDIYRRMLRHQWKAALAHTHVLYRSHKDSNFYRHLRTQEWRYAQRAHLHHQPITIFTPFTGRQELLEDYTHALRSLDSDPNLLRLHCFDVSGNAEFGQQLKDALPSLPFGRITYSNASATAGMRHTRHGAVSNQTFTGFAQPLSQQRCLPTNDAVSRKAPISDAEYHGDLVMADAYNHFLQTCDTEFGLTVDDDVLLSPASLKMMLDTVEEDVAAVVTPCFCRTNHHWSVWQSSASGDLEYPRKRGSGVEEVCGSGFGCSLFRMNMLRQMPIAPSACRGDGERYHHIAFACLRKKGRVLCNWDVQAERMYTGLRAGRAQSVSPGQAR